LKISCEYEKHLSVLFKQNHPIDFLFLSKHFSFSFFVKNI
jgi:hypothetical protein